MQTVKGIGLLSVSVTARRQHNAARCQTLTVAGVLWLPEQHEGLLDGLESTKQSDLQPTGKPVES